MACINIYVLLKIISWTTKNIRCTASRLIDTCHTCNTTSTLSYVHPNIVVLSSVLCGTHVCGYICVSMMTSSNENIYRVTDPFCGEFTGPGEFPTQRPVTRSFDVFFDLRLNKRLNNNREVGDLRRYRAHFDVIVMRCIAPITGSCEITTCEITTWDKHYNNLLWDR